MSRDSTELIEALENLMERAQREQRCVFRDWGVTPVQFLVLRWVLKDPDANMTSLAETLGVRPQTVTPIVDSLEEGGWLQRVRSTEDRRESLLRVTPKGLRLIESIRGSFVRRLDRALDRAPRPALRSAIEAIRIAAAEFEAPAPVALPRARRGSVRSPRAAASQA